MEINLVELWASMGAPVKGVVVVLTIMAVACMGVIIDRIILLLRDGARSRAFGGQVAKSLEAGDHDKVLEIAAKTQGSFLAGLVYVGLRTYLDRVEAGDTEHKAIELTRRALERKNEKLGNELNRGLTVLASTGSTAPFVGLLGTVLGIINAFRLIAASGSGGLGTIGAAIGEALIVTGYGLCVAIPVVIVFNFLQARIAAREGALQNAAGELIDQLEGGGKRAVRVTERETSSAQEAVAAE